MNWESCWGPWSKPNAPSAIHLLHRDTDLIRQITVCVNFPSVVIPKGEGNSVAGSEQSV